MPDDSASLARRFRSRAPAVDHCSLRVFEQRSVQTSVRQDVAEPTRTVVDGGAMVTIIDGDGIGHAATPDLSDAGLDEALQRAAQWARLSRGRSVFTGAAIAPDAIVDARYASPTRKPLGWSKADRIELLQRESQACRIDPRIVDWQASLWTVEARSLIVDGHGGVVQQDFDFVVPALHVVAHDGGLTQVRSWGGRHNGLCRQGGEEVLEEAGFAGAGRSTAEEVLQLLAAPNCPTGRMDLLLMPDQMMLQIHESIGHPLELDRILGDERNFAGTSFVTLSMFGEYQYGSRLLNVTYDPTVDGEFASFAVDDEGSPARREYLIREGRLERPLGGALSGRRARHQGTALPHVATARACSWNRPPIDRMSNLNLEPGDTPLEAMIAGIEDGILMRTNASWSIDDSRNKFQFGCEWGQRIRGGRLAEVVRNPNYRGVSATFWRSLSQVGDASTREVHGTPYCGKGEPNQVVRVGHASPACRFDGVEVFGAER